jgi:hypothetical protein
VHASLLDALSEGFHAVMLTDAGAKVRCARRLAHGCCPASQLRAAARNRAASLGRAHDPPPPQPPPPHTPPPTSDIFSPNPQWQHWMPPPSSVRCKRFSRRALSWLQRGSCWQRPHRRDAHTGRLRSRQRLHKAACRPLAKRGASLQIWPLAGAGLQPWPQCEQQAEMPLHGGKKAN